MPQILRELIVLCATASIAVSSVRAQAPAGQDTSPQLVPRTPEQRERTREGNRRINLHVIVTDRSGTPIAGLKSEDFTILDRGQPQKGVVFEEVNNPANSSARGLVVFDAINSGKPGVDRARKELIRLLERENGPLAFPLQIVLVSDAGTREGQPTKDRSVFTAELGQLPGNIHSTDCDQVGTSQGRWNCMNFHFTKSLNALNGLVEQQRKLNARTIVIWTGPGWTAPRQLDSGQIIPGGGTTGDMSNAIVILEAGMQNAQVTLDAISWESLARAAGVRRTGLHGSLAGASLPEQEAALELPSLAAQTGGQALEKAKDLADALNTCLKDGEQYYSIAFDPAPAAAPNEYRTIEVKVDRPGATVRTLAGYYAQP